MLHRIRKPSLFTVLISGLFLSGCIATPQIGSNAEVKGIGGLRSADETAEGREYHLRPRDELSVLVWGRPDLGAQLPPDGPGNRRISIIQDNGSIQLPFLDSIEAAGKTVAELQNEIEILYGVIVDNPQIVVQLLDYGSKPIYTGGGLHQPTVYVFGEVRRQRAVPVPADGLTFLGALATAGGPNVWTANTDSIFLIRPDTDGPSIFKFSLAELLEGPDITVLPGDRMFVPPTGLARWDRMWDQLLPFFSRSANVYRGFGLAD